MYNRPYFTRNPHRTGQGFSQTALSTDDWYTYTTCENDVHLLLESF